MGTSLTPKEKLERIDCFKKHQASAETDWKAIASAADEMSIHRGNFATFLKREGVVEGKTGLAGATKPEVMERMACTLEGPLPEIKPATNPKEEIFEGLPVERKQSAVPTLKVNWYSRKTGSRPKGRKDRIKVAKSLLSFGEDVAKALDYKRPERIGVGELDGKKVIVFEPGYEEWKPVSKTYSGRVLKGKAMMSFLHGQGVAVGEYEMKKAGKSWIAVPVEVE